SNFKKKRRLNTMKNYKMYINGEFVESENGEYMDVYNPSTGTLVSRVPSATKTDIQKAIDSAEKAQIPWESLPAVERGSFLHKIATKIRENADEIAYLISEEVGKTKELSTVETYFTADYLDYMAEWARRY